MDSREIKGTDVGVGNAAFAAWKKQHVGGWKKGRTAVVRKRGNKIIKERRTARKKRIRKVRAPLWAARGERENRERTESLRRELPCGSRKLEQRAAPWQL
ncbi:hypothetical protein EV2_047722 [Malus domestica]